MYLTEIFKPKSEVVFPKIPVGLTFLDRIGVNIQETIYLVNRLGVEVIEFEQYLMTTMFEKLSLFQKEIRKKYPDKTLFFSPVFYYEIHYNEGVYVFTCNVQVYGEKWKENSWY